MRVNGSEGVLLLECINPYKNKWRLRWDVKPNTGQTEQSIDNTGVNYEEREFLYKPGMDEIKSVILGWYNKQIDEKIRSGFLWEGLPVWLSSENQFNYKAAYDLAMHTGGSSLPVTFKFGTEDSPVYKEFTDLNMLSDFYIQAMQYVTNTLNAGWIEKDSFDWSVYEKLVTDGNNKG